METSQYRREYAAYCSAREHVLYNFYSGASTELSLAPIFERYADLWTREAIAELERAREETPAAFETERAGLASLANAARLNYADKRAREVSQELSRCERAARVEWGGERLGVREARWRIAGEADAARRRELTARWLDAVRACDDLRASRLGALGEAALELDLDSYGALLTRVGNADSRKLLVDADAVIARTGAAYEARLAAWAARHLPPAAARELDHADELFFARLAHLDKYFPAREARATFDAATRGAGVTRHDHLRVEESRQTGEGIARCFGVSPPEDVRLVFSGRGGADLYLNFFDAGGRAQSLSWASRDAAARHPEFIHAPDDAALAGYGFLFRSLFADRAWLAEHRGIRATEANEIASACALTELHDARLACARLRDEFEVFAATDTRSESLAEACAGRRHEATGFRYPAALLLLDLNAGGNGGAAEEVRARLFGAALAEYLRTRHGTRWWARRAAGDELIDLWNTAARYPVEELSMLSGAGSLDPEMLAESLIAAAGGGRAQNK